MSSHLLSLPRELRDMILEFVISAHVEPPTCPALDDTPRKASVGSNCLRLPVLPPSEQYATYGLLLANRQMHQETTTCLRRLPMAYSLDVMMVNHKELWPTWTCCPARSKEPIDFISINVRETRDRPALYLKRLHDILLEQASFASLLEYVASVCCPGHRIRIVKLNLHTPTVSEHAPHISTVKLDWLGWRANSIRQMHPRMSPEDAMNKEGLALRLLTYRIAFFKISDLPVTMLELEVMEHRSWATKFDEIVITVDGDGKAALIRSWEGNHAPHPHSAKDALNRSFKILGACVPSTATTFPIELRL